MMMNDTLTLLNQVSGVSEELGNLADVPQSWIKILTNRGAGDQSEIMPIAQNIRSTRAMGSLVKELADGEKFAGLFLTKEDGTPIGIIRFTGEGGKPWKFITPTGDDATRTQYVNRAVPRWRRGRSQDRWSRETVSIKMNDMSLNDLSSMIPFGEGGIKLFGIKKDANRAAVQQQRQATRSGRDSDIGQIKKGAAQKFVTNKAGGSMDTLKTRIKSVADKVRAKLDQAVSSAATGEYNRGVELLGSGQVSELNSMLSDLASLSRHANDSVEKGVRAQHSYRKGRTYEYDYLVQDLDRINARLDKLGTTGRYESKAKSLVKTVIEKARKK